MYLFRLNNLVFRIIEIVLETVERIWKILDKKYLSNNFLR